MKAELTLSDRFAALGLLPAEGNFATLKIIRKLQEQLSLSEDEIKEYNVIEKDDTITWDNATKATEFEFGEFAEALIKKRLIDLDKQEKLETKHFRLYEMFVGDSNG